MSVLATAVPLTSTTMMWQQPVQLVTVSVPRVGVHQMRSVSHATQGIRLPIMATRVTGFVGMEWSLVVTAITVDEVAVTAFIVALVVGTTTRNRTYGRTSPITRPQQLDLTSTRTPISIIEIKVITLLISSDHSIATEPVTRVPMISKRVAWVA